MAGRAGSVAAVGVVVALVIACAGCGGTDEVQILKIEPAVGRTTGDQPVKIEGTGFRPDIGYTVYFGTKRAESVTILNPETILVMTPSQESAGDVDIHIRSDDGNAFRVVSAFHYQQVAEPGEGGAGADKKGNLAF